MKYINNSQVNVFSTYRNYPYVIKDENGELYQLQHFKGKRTRALKKLVVDNNRVRIASKWVKLSTLANSEISVTKKDLINSLIIFVIMI